MTKRKAVTARMRDDAWLQLIFRQFGAYPRCSICKEEMRPGEAIHADHIHAVVFDGPHEAMNLRMIHYEPCHKSKSKQDVASNAKISRITSGKQSKHPLRSGRGFDRRFRRKMDGTIVKREPDGR